MGFSALPWTTLLIAVGGAVVIVALALLIGVAENRAQQRAWLRIDAARRTNHMRTQALDELLDELGGLPLCPECAKLLTRMAEEDSPGIAH